MTDTEIYDMICRMNKYGGSFVVALSNAIRYADSTNTRKLLEAFPNYVEDYGPNSKLPL